VDAEVDVLVEEEEPDDQSEATPTKDEGLGSPISYSAKH
jgi:hypothetical protein